MITVKYNQYNLYFYLAYTMYQSERQFYWFSHWFCNDRDLKYGFYSDYV